MRRPRFFTQQQLASNATVTLEEEPSRHIGRTLRMAVDDPLVLFDGSGHEWPARVAAVDRSAVTVLCGEGELVDRESPLQIALGIGMSRGDRMDWVVQKATELGVSAIVPLSSERSELRLQGERAGKKLAHWQRISASACEQSGRNRLPTIRGPQALNRWLAEADAQLKLVLDHRAGEGSALPAQVAQVALLVGPEGGLSAAEVDAAVAAGFQPMALGPRVLRTETAPLAVISVLQARWGDLRTP